MIWNFAKMNVTAFIVTTTLTALLAGVVSGQQKPVTGYAPVNGLRMYYEIQGEGEPVVLLHGAFMTITNNWKAPWGNGEFVNHLKAAATKPYDFGADKFKGAKAPMFFIHGDADGVRIEHIAEMFRLKGG